MCIIACSPEGKVINEANIRQMYKSNPDGAGFMYHDKNELIIKKGFFFVEDFLAAYKPHEEKKVVLHFRIKTHGLVNTENCHPYEVSPTLAFVHNGMIQINQEQKDYSDTWHFNERIIKPMYKDNQGFIKKLYNQELIRSFIGNSKLVFMDNKGRASIINPDKGMWVDGIWYSNSSWKIPEVSPPVPFRSKWNEPKFQEGEFVQFRYQYGGFIKGEYAYVEDVIPGQKVRVITHIPSGTPGQFIEKEAIVPIYALEGVEAWNY